MDCKKTLAAVSLSTRLGSVEVEYPLYVRFMQEPSQQVNNTVISFIASNLNELSNTNSTVVTGLHPDNLKRQLLRKSAHSQKSTHLLAQFLV